MRKTIKKGEKINSLTFINITDKKSKDKHLIGIFKCICGKYTKKLMTRVANGYVKTCGDKIHLKGINKKHGYKGTRIYNIWCGIKGRAGKAKYYENIFMDEIFKNSFLEFLKEVGEPISEDLQIDRIDNRKGYIKGNIRWTDKSTQQKNKRNSKFVFIDNKKFDSLTDAANYYKLSKTTIKRYLVGDIDKRRLLNKNKGIVKPRKNCYYENKY